MLTPLYLVSSVASLNPSSSTTTLLEKHAAEGRLTGITPKHWMEVTDSGSPPRKKQKKAAGGSSRGGGGGDDDDVEGEPVLYRKVSGKFVPAASQ